MKIAILGAGAMGSVFGGHLALAGNDVFLINIDKQFVDTVNSNGLVVETSSSRDVVKVAAYDNPSVLGVVDLVLVLVKSFHTKEAMLSALNLVGDQSVVMSLQNGLGQEDLLSEVVGRDKVIAGKTYVGGMMVSPGHVQSGVEGKETIIGELNGSLTSRVSLVEKTFSAAGLKTTATDNIVGAMWDKFLINVAAGALSGITGLNFGNLYDLPEVEEIGVAAVAEAMAVAEALEIDLEIENPQDAWIKASSGLPFEFKTSVLQSIERQMITEIDFINGAVVRAGLKAGVSTPVNSTLVACIKGIERSFSPKKM